MYRTNDARRARARALLVVLALTACLYVDTILDAQDVALPTASLQSVSTIAVCSQEFGTTPPANQKATNQLCGTATESELTIMSFTVNPSQSAGAVNFEFAAFPPPKDDKAPGKFQQEQPCKTTRSGDDCRVFADSPLSVSVGTSPIAIAYQSFEITDRFPYVYLDYASIAKYGDDDEEDPGAGPDGQFSESSLLDSDSDEGWACTYGAEVKLDDDDNIEEIVTKIGGMHSTNGGNYQFDGGCSTAVPLSNPFSLRCIGETTKGKQCAASINARAWCLQRTTGKGWKADETFVHINGPCALQVQNHIDGQSVPWFPHSPLRRDFWSTQEGDSSLVRGGCVVCRADYTDSRYMAGMFGHERKCNTFMQDFRECYVEQLSAVYDTDRSKDVLCTTSEFQSDNCENDVLTGPDEEFEICVESPPGADTSVKSCKLYLPQQQCQQLFGACGPVALGTACFGSYNQPGGFYLPQAGSDQNPGVLQGLLGKRGENLGAGVTPYWVSAGNNPSRAGDQTYNTGHQYRCGHFCGQFPETKPELSEQKDISDQQNIGYVKGWMGLGPTCKAFQLARRGRVQSAVTFDVSVQAQGGGVTESSFSVSSTNVGTGSAISYDPDVKGVGARLLGPASTRGRIASDLGGVVVVCGADPATELMGVSAAPGTINAKLSPSWNVRRNPWPNLLLAINEAQTNLKYAKNGASAIGGCKKGCGMPVAPLITALQCFSCDTASMAPLEVCFTLKQVCEDNPSFECEVPITFTTDANGNLPNDNTRGDAQCVLGGDTVDLDYWNSHNQQVPRGVSWMWYPESDRRAFGSECGQYGMNPWTYGKDSATEQFVCTRPGAEVPCVPGRSADAPTVGVPPPCSMLGGMTDFYCRTSAGTLGDHEVPSVCNFQADPKGCDSSKASSTPLPAGVPPDWVRANPPYWYHRGVMYKDVPKEAEASMSLDVDLYVNGFALNADVENVAPGKFVPVGAVACILQKGSASGTSYTAVQNTGTFTSDYIVEFKGCQGEKGQKSVQPAGAKSQTITVNSGEVRQVAFQLDTPKGASFDATTCRYDLRPAARSSFLLDSKSYGCVVTVPPEQRQPGKFGLDPVDPGGADPGPDDCRAPDIICWVYYGSTWSKVMAGIAAGLIAVFSIYFIIFAARVSIGLSRTEMFTEREEARKSDARRLQYEAQRMKERKEEQRADVRAKLRVKSTLRALPSVIAEGAELSRENAENEDDESPR